MKVLYWILSLTWGLPLTLIGGLIALILILCRQTPHKYLYGWYFTIGKNWGGFSVGPVSILSKDPSRYLLNHEFGHSIQNCFFGPFMLVLVVIPSVIRFWYRKILVTFCKKSYSDLPDYDEVWFEGTATSLGNKLYTSM